MDFDFSSEYVHYSNTELLRITLLPMQYQPAALAAARTVLASRTVTEEEQRLAEESVAIKPKAPVNPSQRWQSGDDLFADADTRASLAGIKPLWWLITLVLGLFICYYTTHELKRLFNNRTFIPGATWDSYVNLLVIATQVTGYIGYWQRKRWGWIITIVWLCYLLFTGLFSLYVLLNSPFTGQTTTFTFQLLIYVGCILLLCRQSLRTHYRVDKPTMQRTLVISISCTVAYMAMGIGLMYYLARH